MSLALVISSCSKDDEGENKGGSNGGTTNSQLVGDWKLIEWRDYDIEGTFANMNITFANMEDKEYESYYDDKEYYSFTSDGVWYEITIEGKYEYAVNKCNVSTANGQIKVIKQTGATGLTYSDDNLNYMSDSEIVAFAKKSNFGDYGGLMELSKGMTMDYKIIDGKLYVIDNHFGSSVSIYKKMN